MKVKEYANLPFSPSKFKLHYGFLIVPLGAIGILMSAPGQTTGISTFTDKLITDHNISRNTLSLAYMFGTIGSSMMLTWAGKQYDRHGVRLIGALASVLIGLILLFLSYSVSIKDLIVSAGVPTTYASFGVLLIGFLFVRFFGQGVLTLVSRNMVMKWFDQYRGLAAGVNNIIVSIGLSLAPVIFEAMILDLGWKEAWRTMAIALGLIFPVVILLFYRDNPVICGLSKDLNLKPKKKKKESLFKVYRDFTLSEARKTPAYWIFSFFLAIQVLYVTGFTFNVTSIFLESGLTRAQGVNIFKSSAIIAAIITIITSAASDYIKLKYLLYIMGFGALCSTTGLIYLDAGDIYYQLLIVGNGFMIGLMGVVASTVWPRFYGDTHLGAISGSAMTMMVFASALGPILFSGALTYFGSYDMAGWICLLVYILLTALTFMANNPQEKLKTQA